MLSNSGHDERGMYSGGQAGDQTGGEWQIVNWYQYPWGGWDMILHHPSGEVRAWIAQLAIEAANNDYIGYDQNERYTFWNQLSTVGFRPANISVPCEADCSAGVAAIVKAVGYILNNPALQGVSIYAWTGNLRQVLTNAGFEVRTGAQFLNGDSYLCAGDILLNEENHTCICVTDGPNAVAGGGGSSSTPTSDEAGYVYKFAPEQVALGSTGLDVARLQVILKARGFYNGKIDSIFGRQTHEAVVAFQKAAGLEVDGVCGPATWATLLGLYQEGQYYFVKNVSIGENDSETVLLLQEFLKALGFDPGDLDWAFGPKTQAALIKFQQAAIQQGAKNIKANGKFDAATAKYMLG